MPLILWIKMDCWGTMLGPEYKIKLNTKVAHITGALCRWNHFLNSTFCSLHIFFKLSNGTSVIRHGQVIKILWPLKGSEFLIVFLIFPLHFYLYCEKHFTSKCPLSMRSNTQFVTWLASDSTGVWLLVVHVVNRKRKMRWGLKWGIGTSMFKGLQEKFCLAKSLVINMIALVLVMKMKVVSNHQFT